MKRAMFILSILLWTASGAYAQEVELPANFPAITTHIYDSNAIGEGYIYLAVAAEVESVGYYLMILENDGAPVWYKELTDDYSYDFKLQANGLPTYAQFLHHHSYTGGGDVVHKVIDPDFSEIESIQMSNGYIAEAHDFQLLPNGHVLLFGYYMTQVDLSTIIEGGYPNALVSGGVVQELDTDRNVVFQWRTWDHYSFEDYSYGRRSTNPMVSAFHLNTINMDVDGHIFIATPEWVKKINRQTGEIIWHLGGDENEFTFIGVDPDEADGHFGGHAFYRLENGNILIYDGGNRGGTRSSQVHEYKLDEENKIAEHVWTSVPDPPVYGWHRGNAQRLPNGNTFIGWGGDGSKDGPACTEVTPEGEKVFELFFDHPDVESYRAFRLPSPTDIPRVYVIMSFVGIGDYHFRHGQIDTGITIRINSFRGTGYNAVGVECVSLAPVYPEFEGRAPRVLPVRVKIGASGISTIDARLSFDVNSFSLTNLEELVVYRRNLDGEIGPFTPLPTTYNPATNQLRADMTDFGEFIICMPDIEHMSLPPLLIEPAPQETVNQELPVALDWTPRGFVNSCHLQVSTDPEFNVLVVDEPDVIETPYVVETVDAGSTYYWRVSTTNDAGASEWSQASFSTIPPMIEITIPNGGEKWERGIEYFIRWEDNLVEDVVIELHKGGLLLQTIDTVPSIGAYKWEVDLALEAGTNYSIEVRSTVDEAMTDASDTIFTIN